MESQKPKTMAALFNWISGSRFALQRNQYCVIEQKLSNCQIMNIHLQAVAAALAAQSDLKMYEAQ